MKRFVASGAVVIYVASVIIFCAMIPRDSEATATEFGVMCINAVYPTMAIEFADSRDNEEIQSEEEAATDETRQVVVSEQAKDPEPVVLGDEPAVLILHTHATESYLPTSEGNYHSKDESNTVRDVGNILATALEKEGISVVHDKTLHDYPSYNSSYSRSY